MKTCSTTHAVPSITTAAVDIATIEKVDDMIDHGVATKMRTAKHLSRILMTEFEKHFDADRGKPGGAPRVTAFTISDTALETMRWLTFELWMTCTDASEKVGELQGDFVEIANAAYDARQGMVS